MPFKPIEAPKCPTCGKSVYAAEEIKYKDRSYHKPCFQCKGCKKSLALGQFKEHEDEPYCNTCHSKMFGPKGFGAGMTGVYEKPESEKDPGGGADEEKARSAIFQVIDKDDSGGITKQEWETIFDVLDENKDGGISRKEWYLKQGTSALFDAISKKSLASITREEWTKSFDTFDLDKDGEITLKEWCSEFNAAAKVVAPTRGTKFVMPEAPKCPTCGKSVYKAEEVVALGSTWHALCFCCNGCGKSLRLGQYKDNDNKAYCDPCYKKTFGPKGIGFGVMGDTGHAAGTKTDASGGSAAAPMK